MSGAERLSWVMMGFGILGFLVSFPLWLTGNLTERNMLGLTLVLSWAALWYAAALFIYEAKQR